MPTCGMFAIKKMSILIIVRESLKIRFSQTI